MKNTALSSAIQAAGGLTPLADALGISKQAISSWKRCPPHHVLKVEKLTRVPRHKLRPDLYPVERP